MDIVLELCDTFLFDHIYAAILPAKPSSLFLKDGAINGTQFDAKAYSSWQYEASNQYLSWTPRDAAYMSEWTRDNAYRQIITLLLLTWLAGAAIYFTVASLSYIFVFDKTTFQHPKFLKNQIKMEIKQAWDAMPWIAVMTVPFFFAEIQGYSKLYDSLADEPMPYYNWLQFPFFLAFTDFFIYLIHRGLHHPSIYKHMHKAHHKWIMPTPYAAVAFHPVDGFLQSLPYHVFPFLFPLQKFAYLGLFVFVQIWTVFIHDGEYVANGTILNGAACHTMHHLFFNYNYGQYTTLWDRLGGTYRKPNEELFRRETRTDEKEISKQVKEMETIVKEVEGEDFRTYGAEGDAKKKN